MRGTVISRSSTLLHGVTDALVFVLPQDVWGSGGTALCFLKLCTCSLKISFMLSPPYARGKNPVPIARDADWAGDSSHAVGRQRILALLRVEPRFTGRPSRKVLIILPDYPGPLCKPEAGWFQRRKAPAEDFPELQQVMWSRTVRGRTSRCCSGRRSTI
jgi:hypothetical protein